jgi:hypothetical protein
MHYLYDILIINKIFIKIICALCEILPVLNIPDFILNTKEVKGQTEEIQAFSIISPYSYKVIVAIRIPVLLE